MADCRKTIMFNCFLEDLLADRDNWPYKKFHFA